MDKNQIKSMNPNPNPQIKATMQTMDRVPSRHMSRGGGSVVRGGWRALRMD